jgi:hypothetical protein
MTIGIRAAIHTLAIASCIAFMQGCSDGGIGPDGSTDHVIRDSAPPQGDSSDGTLDSPADSATDDASVRDASSDTASAVLGDSSADTRADAASPSHGCHPSDLQASAECGGAGWSCTSMHSCCAGFGSDCMIHVTQDAGHTPCSSDDMCAATEYCQTTTSECCPVGYRCVRVDGGANDGAAHDGDPGQD